jgi:hypothetical protein
MNYIQTVSIPNSKRGHKINFHVYRTFILHKGILYQCLQTRDMVQCIWWRRVMEVKVGPKKYNATDHNVETILHLQCLILFSSKGM